MNTDLRKRTLKKLIKESCSDTVFTENKKLYQQIDGVSMGGSLKLLLTNIIMTELKQEVTKQCNNDKPLFYGRFVNDTLVAIKPEI